MTDREKVIAAYICSNEKRPDKRCEKCPYGYEYLDQTGDDYFVCCNTARIMVDAIDLLIAQEPRVLALNEIHRGMAVWLEDVDKADVILAIGGSSAGGAKCFITENDTSIAPLSAEYGIRWRAWTAEPTEDQREATPWN